MKPLLAASVDIVACATSRFVHVARDTGELLTSWRLPAPALLLDWRFPSWRKSDDMKDAWLLVVSADGSVWRISSSDAIDVSPRKRSREIASAPHRRPRPLSEAQRFQALPSLGALSAVHAVGADGLVFWRVGDGGAAQYATLPLTPGDVARVTPCSALNTTNVFGGGSAPAPALLHVHRSSFGET